MSVTNKFFLPVFDAQLTKGPQNIVYRQVQWGKSEINMLRGYQWNKENGYGDPTISLSEERDILQGSHLVTGGAGGSPSYHAPPVYKGSGPV